MKIRRKQIRIAVGMVIALVCLLMTAMAAGDSWNCTACGAKGNTGNFCPECGASKASAAEKTSAGSSSATLNSSVSYSGGITTIKWTGSGNYYVLIQAVNGSSVQHVWNVGSSSNGSLATSLMMPGKTYEVSLISAADFSTADEKTVTVPRTDTFQDGKLKDTSVKVSIEGRKLKNGDPYNNAKAAKKLSANTIIAALNGDKETYGFRYHMRMPQLAKPRSFYVSIFIESPDGYLEPEVWGDVTFDRVSNGYQTIWWNFLGSDYFKNLYETTGSVPAGNYEITMYWDGMFVNRSTLKVSP